MSQKNFLVFAIIFILVLVPWAYAGKVELTTYYPAPYGEYTSLQAQSLLFQETGANPSGLIGFNYGDTTYDGRLRVTAGKSDTFDNDQGASIDLHGNSNSSNPGNLDLVAGRGGAMRFWSSPAGTTATERMRINSAGNVGIGTSSPYQHLALDGAGSGALAITGASGGQFLLMGNRDSSGVNNPAIIEAANGNLYFGHGNSWTNSIGGTMTTIMSMTSTGIVVTGTITATGSCCSDIRLKKNIQAIPSPLDRVLRLRGVGFEWRRDEFKDRNFPKGKQIGVIAQEVEKEFPELVSEDAQGFKGVAYEKLGPILIEAIKEQQKEIDLLKKDIEELKKR